MSATEVMATEQAYRGTDKLLFGIVLGVITFWLFAGTVGTVAPEILKDINRGGTEYVNAQAMNLGVSITALFSPPCCTNWASSTRRCSSSSSTPSESR